MHGVKLFQAATVLSIRTALLLSSVIVAVLVALAHPLPAAASLDGLMPYEVAP